MNLFNSFNFSFYICTKFFLLLSFSLVFSILFIVQLRLSTRYQCVSKCGQLMCQIQLAMKNNQDKIWALFCNSGRLPTKLPLQSYNTLKKQLFLFIIYWSLLFVTKRISVSNKRFFFLLNYLNLRSETVRIFGLFFLLHNIYLKYY